MNSIDLPIPLIVGESVIEVSQTINGLVAITNYRLYIESGTAVECNIPVSCIESVHIDKLSIAVFTKDNRTYRCSFELVEKTQAWYEVIQRRIAPLVNITDSFAFTYFLSAKGEDPSCDYDAKELHDQCSPFSMECKRLKFDKRYWRVTKSNHNFKLCATYPPLFLVPRVFSDSDLLEVARFRSGGRIPVVVWRHAGNGAVVIRSSQPNTGLFRRNMADEELLKSIRSACARNSPDPSREDDPQWTLLFMDARDTMSAMGNCLLGGGYEYGMNYMGATIERLGLPNIHTVRLAHNNLRSSSQEWFLYLSKLLNSANQLVTAVHIEGRPVLVHCSDGWDRTPQVVSLALLMLDPFYRTCGGFRVLIEREWRDFGHKFTDRSSIVNDEGSPIFLQWLDAVHQLLKQNPTSFQFNQTYLLKMAMHLYSNLYGTFLCNSVHERETYSVNKNTFSVWSLLREPSCQNTLYMKDDKVLVARITDIYRWAGITQPPITSFPAPEAEQINCSFDSLKCKTDICNLTDDWSVLDKDFYCDDSLDLDSIDGRDDGLNAFTPATLPDEANRLEVSSRNTTELKPINEDRTDSVRDESKVNLGSYSTVSMTASLPDESTRLEVNSGSKQRTISEELCENFDVLYANAKSASSSTDDGLPKDAKLTYQLGETNSRVSDSPISLLLEEKTHKLENGLTRPRMEGRPAFGVDGLLYPPQDNSLSQIEALVTKLRIKVRRYKTKIYKPLPISDLSQASSSASDDDELILTNFDKYCMACRKCLTGGDEEKVCLPCVRAICASCITKKPLLPNQEIFCELCQFQMVPIDRVPFFKSSLNCVGVDTDEDGIEVLH